MDIEKIEINAASRTGLERKVEEHNEEYGNAPTKRATYRMLAASFKRGIGAYKTNPESVRPNVQSPEQWAFARVNSLLYALRNGKFRRGAHDRDLLPAGHPMSTKTRKEDDLYPTPNEAIERAREIGCIGYHTHEVDGTVMYMPCDLMSDYELLTGMAHRGSDDLSLVEKVEWTTAYVNDLPDSAFFYVGEGEQDDEGKTTPRTLRKLPYRDAEGNIDLPHVRSALSYLSRTDIPDSAKERIRAEAQEILERAAMRKAYEEIDFTPPKGVQEAAELGLALRREHGRGGTAVGVARARDLSNGSDVSPDTIRRMVSYFQRHAIDLDVPKNNDRSHPEYPGAGRIAWLLWGGDPGERWANKVRDQMDREDEAKKGSQAVEKDLLQASTTGDLVTDLSSLDVIKSLSGGTSISLSYVPNSELHLYDTTAPGHGLPLPNGLVVKGQMVSNTMVLVDALFINDVCVASLPYSVRKQIMRATIDRDDVVITEDELVNSSADVAMSIRKTSELVDSGFILAYRPDAPYSDEVVMLDLESERTLLWNYVPPRTANMAKAVFVCGQPNRIESIRGVPLAGADGVTFQKSYLDRLSLRLSDVDVIHAVPTVVDTADDWNDWLQHYVTKSNDVPVIALGKMASIALGDVEHTTLPHPRAIRLRGDRGEIERKSKQIRKSLRKNVLKSIAAHKTCPIFKADEAKKIVYGVVLEPHTVDLQGDVLSIDEIEQAAYAYLVNSRVVGDSHSRLAEAEVVESYLAPTDIELGGQQISKGTWIMGVRILNEDMWAQVMRGEFTGFSIGGTGERKARTDHV